MTKNVTGTRFAIEWRGYDDNRPAGWPRVLCEMYVIGHQSKEPREIAEFPHSLGGGYCVSISHVPAPMKQLGKEALVSVRRKRLERRLQKKAPLFAELFAQEEMARKPGYYAGITDEPFEQARQEAIAYQQRVYETMLSHAGELLVYAQEPEECRIKAQALWDEMADLRARLAPTRVGEGQDGQGKPVYAGV